MAAGTVRRREVTDAYLELLRNATGKQVFDTEVTKGAVLRFPYAVVQLVPGGSVFGDEGGPVAAPDGTIVAVYQVSSVGETRRSAEWMADEVRRATLGRSATSVTGWLFDIPLVDPHVRNRESNMFGGFDHEGPLVNVHERFQFTLDSLDVA